MSERQDIRRQTREIHEALSRFEREQVVDILTHVFRTYVMEGAALAAPSTTAVGDELTGLSFAQLIERLQLRLDLPELQLFEVQGNRVSVRIEGRLTPLELPAARAEAPAPPREAPAPVAAPVATPAPAAPAPLSPGSETRALGASPPGVAPVGYASAARPDAPRPTAAAARPAAAGPGGTKPAAAPAQPVAPAAKPAEETTQGGRFGLLEID